MVEAARGADLLVLPEYTSAVWLNWALADVTAVREVAWMAEQAESILPAYPELVQRHGVALLAGSGPAGETVEGPGPLTFARLPLGEIRRLRAGAAEVWPGAWFADHVRTEGG